VNFASIGGSLICIGLLSSLMAFPTLYGVRKHNRFVLISLFFFDLIFGAQLVALGSKVLAYTTPVFSKDLQADCLLNTPLKHTYEQCFPFYSSDRTIGFRLLWSWLYSTYSNPLQFQIMNQIEIGDACCGFFAPMSCKNITRSMPVGHPLTAINPELVQERLTCGPYPGYYPQQADCTTYYSQTVLPYIVGGCNYDLGVGPCLSYPVTSSSSGCASYVEDYAATLITSPGKTIIGAAAMNLIAMLVCCCMWWKRKQEDVFPNFLREERAGKIVYAKVKEQFTVHPKEHYLILKRFLPPTKYAKVGAEAAHNRKSAEADNHLVLSEEDMLALENAVAAELDKAEESKNGLIAAPTGQAAEPV